MSVFEMHIRIIYEAKGKEAKAVKLNEIFGRRRVEEALKRISEGDMTGLTALYDSLGKQIFALVFSIVKNYPDSEDAMQETFARVTEKINTYRKDGNGRAWIMSIARNIAIDTLRNKKQTVEIESMDYIPDEGDFTKAAEINDLLANLEEKDRDIVILKAVNGFKFKEICEIVELSQAATEKRYRRALAKLKEIYNKE